MNQHLQQRVADLLAQYDTVTLATCGPAGPQISRVPYRVQQLDLYLFVPHGSDHLFNLESQPESCRTCAEVEAERAWHDTKW